MVVLTRSAAKLKENQVEFKPSKPETVVTLSDQNLRAASKGHSAPSKGPSAPKKNAKSVNLLKTLVSEVQNKKYSTTDTKNKGEKQPASKVSSTIESPEAAAKQNPNPNMKPSQKKSTKKPRTKKCLFHPVQ
ncbi:uncharacterized protein LOC122619258 isoform X2 [Drosophila teissieri]|uniref:uncharacterized protein LOC122619258 isoform X2 n=1 Tax=Drosophila teissieri TaxID=7243 RepID=UPI001CBA0A5B|nr:uncharacterized protein LOC122619258 isoform X2 [Drosophila teissieri]